MNPRLKAAALLSGVRLVKSRGLVELGRLAADAFETEYPAWEKLSYPEQLGQFARFTKQEAEKALASGGSVEAMRSRLRDNARRFGRKIRRKLRLSSPQDVMTAARILYRVIKIDLEGTSRGEIVVRKCFFSAFYSPGVCELMSALDEGILAGLADGGELRFRERLSEGKNCCRAQFSFGREPR
jgi:hypothetical protein